MNKFLINHSIEFYHKPIWWIRSIDDDVENHSIVFTLKTLTKLSGKTVNISTFKNVLSTPEYSHIYCTLKEMNQDAKPETLSALRKFRKKRVNKSALLKMMLYLKARGTIEQIYSKLTSILLKFNKDLSINQIYALINYRFLLHDIMNESENQYINNDIISIECYKIVIRKYYQFHGLPIVKADITLQALEPYKQFKTIELLT